jgi:NAD(P)-dependent dehydrogenase (short-subunit alcohol dehydrogenase family)
VDLANFNSVRTFAEKFNTEVSRLDILVANAASSALTFRLSNHGFEELYVQVSCQYQTTIIFLIRLQVNNLGSELLCILLLPKMIETANDSKAAPRLVVVCSDAHHTAPRLSPAILESPSIHAALSNKDWPSLVNSSDHKLHNAVHPNYPISKRKLAQCNEFRIPTH